MESVEVKLARIEEILHSINGKVAELAKIRDKVQTHETEIALLKRDKKWEKHIGNTVSGILGGALYAFFDWFKK